MYRLIGVTKNDRVLDATCGSGAFLVKAMCNMIKEAGGVGTNKAAEIKKERLFGIEMYRKVFALACANMLIHKDGKTNLEQMDAMSTEAADWIRSKNITKVLMNPPYAMCIAGIDVCQSSPNSTASVWIENRPLDDGRLEKLVFAVATNPLLSGEQITEILQYLTPFVTEYQEEQLVGTATNTAQTAVTDDYINTYTVISHAIRAQRRVSFVAPHHKYSHTNSIKSRDIHYRVSFTPKWILPFDGELYVVGYNNQTKYIEAF